MSLPLTQRLTSMGLLANQPLDEVPQSDTEAQMVQAKRRQAIMERLSPHWGEFLATWLSPGLRQATLGANESQRRDIAQAWADCLDARFKGALVELAGPDLQAMLLPWVEATVNRRHVQLPLAAGALLEEWCAVLDPEDPEDGLAFWSHVAKHLRELDSRHDREIASAAVEPLGQALRGVLQAQLAEHQKGWKRLKVWQRTAMDWLPELLQQPAFIRFSGAEVTRHTASWKDTVDAEQAFPALAMGLETWMTSHLGTGSPEEVVALETWLAASIQMALPHVLPNKFDTPRVARLVRESLHLDTHAQSLAPPPVLTR